jgi:hypothetical protein
MRNIHSKLMEQVHKIISARNAQMQIIIGNCCMRITIICTGHIMRAERAEKVTSEFFLYILLYRVFKIYLFNGK